jgi:uncharacterized protein (TIGR00661 family)
VGPILRDAVRRTPPVRGDHLLVYFTNASDHFTASVERALRQVKAPVKVYGLPREGQEGNLRFCPIADLPFARDLASARAVFSTAGNQLISEAIHFGKPLLLVPEEAVEQRINAHYVQRWGIGQALRPGEVTADRIEAFLARAEDCAARTAAHQADGLAEALAAIDEAFEALTSAGRA